ncbi:hypothetical protein [Spiroplasma endosymbiont of Tiphia femorata]|uniref:hypothetical protein n=1 Tax=Spiroplasma endosymbiont of Tiphia femorata TaxID=3066326 RepID=UPI0030CF69E4
MLENETNVEQNTEPLTENNNLQQEQEIKIVELENKLNKLNQEIKEKEIINIFKKYQVKKEFYEFLKFKTNNLENSKKIEETIKKIIKEQPVFKETINTGGNKQIIINNKTNDKENFLINYKKKNYL